MALTKAKLVENLFEVLEIDKQKAEDLVEIFFEEIRSALEQGQQLRLSGFGNFNLLDKRERPGRNPKNGKDFLISSRRVVTFRVGQKLKARVEKYAGPAAAKIKSIGSKHKRKSFHIGR